MVERRKGGREIVELGNVTDHRKAGKDFARGAIWHVGGNDAYYRYRGIAARKVKSRTTADAVDGDAVNEVGALGVHPGTYISCEKAQAGERDSRKAEPANLFCNLQKEAFGREWKGL